MQRHSHTPYRHIEDGDDILSLYLGRGEDEIDLGVLQKKRVLPVQISLQLIVPLHYLGQPALLGQGLRVLITDMLREGCVPVQSLVSKNKN